MRESHAARRAFSFGDKEYHRVGNEYDAYVTVDAHLTGAVVVRDAAMRAHISLDDVGTSNRGYLTDLLVRYGRYEDTEAYVTLLELCHRSSAMARLVHAMIKTITENYGYVADLGQFDIIALRTLFERVKMMTAADGAGELFERLDAEMASMLS